MEDGPVREAYLDEQIKMRADDKTARLDEWNDKRGGGGRDEGLDDWHGLSRSINIEDASG